MTHLLEIDEIVCEILSGLLIQKFHENQSESLFFILYFDGIIFSQQVVRVRFMNKMEPGQTLYLILWNFVRATNLASNSKK